MRGEPQRPVRLRFWGHGCFELEAPCGQRLIIDPYEPGGLGGAIGYGPVSTRADWVVCSHGHGDHAAVASLPGAPELLEGGDVQRGGPFVVRRVAAWHDEYGGRRRGGPVDLLCVEVGGWRVAHLWDVGQSPTPEQIEGLGEVDLALIPVGGFYTIGAAQGWEWGRRLGAPWVVPCHQKTARCGLSIRDEAGLLAHVGARREAGAVVELGRMMLTIEVRALVMRPLGSRQAREE